MAAPSTHRPSLRPSKTVCPLGNPAAEPRRLDKAFETTLSLRSALPDMAMAPALSAAHLAANVFPPTLERLYVIRDNDPAGDGARDYSSSIPTTTPSSQRQRLQLTLVELRNSREMAAATLNHLPEMRGQVGNATSR